MLAPSPTRTRPRVGPAGTLTDRRYWTRPVSLECRVEEEERAVAKEELVGRTFVELADTLVDSYDPLVFLHHLAARCVEVLGIAEAGLVLVDARGQLQALASSNERMRLIELLEVQRQDGPCLDCWRDGGAVVEDHLAGATGRWPHFAPAALEAGFASAYAVPMRLRDERLGALNLFANEAAGLSGADQAVAQAMADVATIGILHERFIARREARGGHRTASGGVQHPGGPRTSQRPHRRGEQGRHGSSLRLAARLRAPSQPAPLRGGTTGDRPGARRRRTRDPAPQPPGPPALIPHQARVAPFAHARVEASSAQPVVSRVCLARACSWW